MTEKEAIGYIKDLQDMLTKYDFHFSKEFAEANRMALEALELQIPKKVKIERGRFTKIYCPWCGELIEDYGHEPFYCDDCGQRLDWSEGDD